MHPFKYIITSYFKVRIIKKLLPNKNIESLLDIGCGGGLMISQLTNYYNILYFYALSLQNVLAYINW